MAVEEKILCRTPTPGKKPTRLDAARFAAYRTAILSVLRARREPVPFKELSALVKEHFDGNGTQPEGSVGWNVTTVKLELEVRGEIERLPEVTPQKLRLTKRKAKKS